MYYLYILRCSDNSLYTGITSNPEERFKKYHEEKGAKYVRARLPFEHIYTEEYNNRREASKREYEIKRSSRDDKAKNLKLRMK